MFSYLRPDRIALVVLFHLLLLLSIPVNALPLRARQTTGPPKSVTTVQTTNTPQGPVTQTCVIVFTPVKDAQGNDAVEEVRTCTVTMGGATTALPGTTTSTSTSTSTSTDTSTATGAATTTAANTSTGTSTTSASTSTTTTSTSTTGPPSGVAGGNPIVVVGVSTVTVPTSTATSSAATTTATSTSTTSTSIPTGTGSSPIVVVGTSTVSPPVQSPVTDQANDTSGGARGADTTPSPSGTAAAVESPTATGFTLPGTKLSVLPIGLGVFAGISVIALIVVGLVTYERTKYRKAFRQRKLAESGAAMGYGGNNSNMV